MDLIDARIVLGALVDDMYDKHFPDLKLDGKMHGLVFEIYLDFASDKVGYWTAVKSSYLITAQLNLREKKESPLHTAQAVIEFAMKLLELTKEEHQKNNRFISAALPDPEIHRFFQPSDPSSTTRE